MIKLLPAPAVEWLVVHYSATYTNQDVSAADIDRMHRQRGFAKIGYHYFIRRDGRIERGRAHDEAGRFEQGAHSQGENDRSLGICYEGGLIPGDPNTGRDTRTPAQIAAMVHLLSDLCRQYPGAKVEGHRDMPGAATQCPGFDVAAWWALARPQVAARPSLGARLLESLAAFLRRRVGS